ncbi:uncharacterized protein LOC135472338 isoform X2 [Liolophura sinensis]|uniref:uncharacterized protein LOC135472338 isoform X2 n=1 Tax=Liolophura sinensis TaxID=3198878 RepID=UPI003159028F
MSGESLLSEHTDIATETVETVLPRSVERKMSGESLSSEHTDIVTETVETVLPRSVERKVSVESLSSEHTDIVTETVETVLPRSVERKVSVESLSSEHTDIVTESVETVFPRSVERKMSVESLSSEKTDIVTETVETVFPRSMERKVSVDSLSSDDTDIVTETVETVFPRSVERKMSVESLSSDDTDIVTESVETVFPRSMERKVSVESLSSDDTDIVTETVETVFPRSMERNVSVESLSSDDTDIVTETVETVFPRSMERKVSVESLSSDHTDIVTETVETVSYRIDSDNRNDLKADVTERNYNKNRESDEETIRYETEEIILPSIFKNKGNESQGISQGDSENEREKTSHSYASGERLLRQRSGLGYSRLDSLSDSYGSDRQTESFYSSERQASLIRNDNDEQTVKYTNTGITKPSQVWGFDTGFSTSRQDPRDKASTSFRQSNASDSDLEESLGSITTLQDNENLSDLSNLDDTLGSRTEENAGGEQSRYLRDYTRQRDISRNTSFSEDTYTSVHEEFYVPIPQKQTEARAEGSKGHSQADNFPSYRERFYGRSTGETGGPIVRQDASSTYTFQPETRAQNVSESSDGFSERYSNVNGAEQKSQENDSVLLWSSLFSQPDTVQGRSAWQAHSSEQADNRVFTDPSGYREKPAEQLRENNINIAKKGDSWGDHVIFSSSNPPVYGVRLDGDSDVTAQAELSEEFDKDREKLSGNAFSANFTSESRPGKYEKSLNGGNHSLFYDGSADTAQQVKGVRRLYTSEGKDKHQSGQKYQRGSMAYLLTGKEHMSGDVNRSGSSTPQRKDLYVEEDIVMSHGGVDERRGSHSSRDYLSDNHGGQDFFHFDMKSPSNNHREANEGRRERIQHIERSETRTVNSASDHVEVLPDTYIGTSIPSDLPDSYIGKSKSPTSIPIHIKTNGRSADEVSQNSSRVSLHENKTSSNHRPYDKKDGKGSRDKKSEHRRTEHTTTTYMSSQNHNGDSRNHGTSERSGRTDHTNVIHVQTNTTGLDSGRRERRNVDLTSKHELGKPSGDDNISISSLSSQSSSSFAEAGNSFVSPASRNPQRKEKRGLHAEKSRRADTVSVEYISENRQPVNQASMPKHAKKTHYYSSNVESDFSDRDQRSSKDVQYLIKSLENDTKHPRRPIPGVDRDAFSYHVTSSSNENKSSSRNNHVNEVDVTTREAMRDRTNKPVQGSSHVIRQYKEERIVEDVKGPSSVHLAPERVDSGQRTIVLQNGQPQNRAIKIHASSLDRSDSDRTATLEDSKRHKKKGHPSAGETKLYVDSSGAPHHRVKSEKVRVVKEKTYHKSHSVSSDDYSSDEEGGRRRKPDSGKVSTVLYDFSSKQHPSLSNVVHLEGASGLKSRDSVNSQDIYSTPRNTDKPYRARSSSESSLSDHDQRKGTGINKAKSQELWLTQDLNRHQPRKYKSENVFYEHYNVKRENPMYVEGDKVVYVSPHTKHGARSPTREIYVDTKSHPTHRHQLSSSFSSISPAGSPTPEDRHVTTVSFDESFNRKRSGSPIIENNVYKPKVHVKKHRVVKTDQQIIRPAESDNELYVRGSRSSPYRVVVKGDRQRSGRSSDTDDSFYSDTRTSGSHRSTINISRGSDKRPDPNVPAVMSIPLSNHPVAMTIPGVQETKYVTNKSERVELRRSASLDSVRDMVDYPTDLKNSFRSEKVLHLGSSSDGPSSPEMRSPSSPYVSTITILNRKLNVKDPNVDSGNGTEIISSDDDIRYRSQLNPVKEEVVYATKEVPRSETRRSEKHTTYTTYEEYRDSNDSYEYVKPSQQKVTTIRQERQIPIREERIRPVREDRAKAVRESLHEKFSNMSYEQSHEPQQVEQKSTSDLKVVRGQFVIRNSMDIDLDEGDSLGVDDNINIFDNSFTMNKENPLYQSDPDIYNKFESETVEERKIRIKEGDFGDGFEDIIQNTRQAALKSAPNKKKQNLSQMLLSKLAQIDSKDITQHIDVQHNNEEIYGDIKFIHADGSKSEAMDTTNFDSVSEHIDLMLKEGKALITIKVTAERIIPIDFEFNVWRKSQAIVTRNIEIDLKANDQRRRLYEHVMETTPRRMIGSGSSSYQQSDEAVLSSKDTLKLFTRLLSVADKDEKAIERDEVRYETKHRDRSDSLPSLSNADMLY